MAPWVRTHPPDCNQDAAVGVDHEQKWQQQAEDEETQHVGDAGWGPEVPLDRARGARTLRPVAAPSQQRRHGPDQRVEPGAGDADPGFPEVGGVHRWRVQHGGVTLVGEDRQRHQGHDPWDIENMKGNKMLFPSCKAEDYLLLVTLSESAFMANIFS